MICSNSGQIKFRSVQEAMIEANVQFDDTNDFSILVWHDALKDVDYFTYLKPWQVVNRIPNMNVICRKAPFTRILQRIHPYFPELYTFLPKSYILPFKNDKLLRAIETRGQRFIIKPDGGSLGLGITIVEPKEKYTPNQDLAVAQVYINSFLIHNTKFDLRIYVLVASVSPMRIYMYHDGLARFCSKEAGESSVFSQLTNVTLNRGNPDMEITEISQMITDVFPQMSQMGIDIDALWNRIETAVGLTVIAAAGPLSVGADSECKSIGYSRCFQILGFDVLIDRNMKPWVLEVNYRPSLDYYRGKERRMKVSMIRDAILLAAPLVKAQDALMTRKWAWNAETWSSFLAVNTDILQDAKMQRKRVQQRTKFVKVFPSKKPDRLIWKDVLKKAKELPLELMPGFRSPEASKNREDNT